MLLTGCIVYIGEGFPLLVIYDQAGWKGGGKVKRSCTFLKKSSKMTLRERGREVNEEEKETKNERKTTIHNRK